MIHVLELETVYVKCVTVFKTAVVCTSNRYIVCKKFVIFYEFFYFFFYEKPSVFAICKNTFSKWKAGGGMAWRRVLSSAPL
jgi:hypothetical protein